MDNQKKSQAISKTDVMRYERCQRLSYLAVATPTAAVDTPVFFAKQGIAVEDFYATYLAKKLPDHLVVTIPLGTKAARTAATNMALQNGSPVIIHQAAFSSDEGVFCALDNLVLNLDGTVNLIEVKSASADPEEENEQTDKKTREKYLDTLVQYRTAVRAGQRVDRVILVRLNKTALSPDTDSFIYERDITAYCEANLAADWLTQMVDGAKAAVLSSTEVLGEVGGHCKSPHRCHFYDLCHAALPKEGVHTLNRLHPSTRKKLADAKVVEIASIPSSFKLSGVAAKQREAIQTGRPVVDHESLRDGLSLRGPIAFLDFETVATAMPKQDNYGPWAHMVVQASVHVTTEDGSIVGHHEWLATKDDAQNGSMAASAAAFLEKALRGVSTVVSYNQTFEIHRLRELARLVPSFQETAASAEASMVDLLRVIEAGYYHRDFGGSLSVKRVLPVLVPGMHYGDLAVKDGGSAMEVAHDLIFGNLTQEAAETARRDLLTYCAQDTLAMVKIYQVLRGLVGLKVG